MQTQSTRAQTEGAEFAQRVDALSPAAQVQVAGELVELLNRAPEPPEQPVAKVLRLLAPVTISPPSVPKGIAGLSSRTFKDSVDQSVGALVRVDWTSRVVWLGWVYDMPEAAGGGKVTAWAWTPFENVQSCSCETEMP